MVDVSTTFDPGTIWLVVTAVAAVSLAFRLSFFLLFSRVETVPTWAERVLYFVGPAVIAALVLPSVLIVDGTVAFLTPEVAAALVAALVAWRTENIAATVGAGMVVLWALTWAL